MVHDYYFSRPRTGSLHFYNYYLDQQPDIEHGQYNIVVQLPNLGNELVVSSDNGFFTLNSSSKSNEIVVGFEIWKFEASETFRSNVRKDYLIFLKNVEDSLKKLEENKNKPSDIHEIQILKTRIAEVMPMTFEELLFYHYGFDQEQGYIDLQPGMRLRVDYQNYQFVAPSDPTAINGFVGSGSSFYQVHRYMYPTATGAKYRLGFDGFLSRIHLLVSSEAAQGGAGGIVDLLDPAYRRPYYRLFYPKQISNSTGHIGAERVAVLIGADSLDEMGKATAKYLNNNGELPNTDKSVGFYFRGRATVIPEISVFVNEQPLFVPVGTTVRQLMERYDNIPVDQPGQDLVRLQGASRPQRLIHKGVNGIPSYQFINYKEIRQTSSGSNEFDLPVVKGDRFYL